MSKTYDPPMHTAEHVLNQTMVRMFGCKRSYSSHLNSGKSKCDYHFPRPLDETEAAALEKRVNEVLCQKLAVRESFLPRAEAEKKVRLDKLPAHLENVADLKIRLVEVGDYDICPCIGEHVANTAEIGTFRLISHDFTPPEAEPAAESAMAPGSESGGQDVASAPSGRLRLRFKLA